MAAVVACASAVVSAVTSVGTVLREVHGISAATASGLGSVTTSVLGCVVRGEAVVLDFIWLPRASVVAARVDLPGVVDRRCACVSDGP